MLTDPTFQKAAFNTLYFVVVGVPLTILVALAIAIALNTGITKLSGFFRIGYYMPVVTSIVAVAVVWRFLLRPENGLVNEVLSWVGITGPDWLGSTTWAMPSLIAMSVWRSLGTLVVIFLAGLQSVPKALHEAAALDGANAWQRLRRITIPTIRPTMLFAGVITGIGFLQFFEEPFVMTQGGPLNSTLSVAYLVYNTFGFGNYGVAAAMSYVLFAAVVAPDDRAVHGAGRARRRDRLEAPLVPPLGRCVRMTAVTEAKPLTKPRGTEGSHIGEPQARPVALRGARHRPRARRHAVRLDAARLVQDRGRAARQPAHLVARRTRRSTTSASCSRGSTSRSSSPTRSSSRSP